MRSKGSKKGTRLKPNKHNLDEWERSWLEHWSKAGTKGYELPKIGPAGEEAAFLTEVRSPEKEMKRLERIQQEFVRGFRGLYDLGPAVTVFGSARFKEQHPYYKLARAVAQELARTGFATLTGGGPGIMEAANRGAFEAGGTSYGLNIVLPHEQAPNPYITPSLNFEFHYFFMRKLWFAYLSKALVVFPGGFGTIDEMFEILTLTQTEKLAKKITVVVYGSDYWKRVFNIQALVDTGAISPDDVELFQYADTPEEAFECLKKGLTENYPVSYTHLTLPTN